MLTRRRILATVLILAAAAVCIRLGIWQLDRLAERRAFNAHVLSVQAMTPLPLPANGDLTAMEYRAVTASGTYDFQNQVAIRNQYNGIQPGYHLLTPLRLADGEAVLVDRGWIPAEGNSSPDAWHQYDQPGPINVQGIIRLGQIQPTFGSDADPTLTPEQTRLDFWIYVNLNRIAEQIPYSILPVYIQLNPDPARTDPPVPIQPTLDLSEGPHMSYAIQWFSFSVLFILGYGYFIWRKELRQKA